MGEEEAYLKLVEWTLNAIKRRDSFLDQLQKQRVVNIDFTGIGNALNKVAAMILTQKGYPFGVNYVKSDDGKEYKVYVESGVLYTRKKYRPYKDELDFIDNEFVYSILYGLEDYLGAGFRRLVDKTNWLRRNHLNICAQQPPNISLNPRLKVTWVDLSYFQNVNQVPKELLIDEIQFRNGSVKFCELDKVWQTTDIPIMNFNNPKMYEVMDKIIKTLDDLYEFKKKEAKGIIDEFNLTLQKEGYAEYYAVVTF